jgi:hypothetical protein
MRSDCADVQSFLRDSIRQGRIHVRPWPGQPNRVKIERVGPEPVVALTTRRA